MSPVARGAPTPAAEAAAYDVPSRNSSKSSGHHEQNFSSLAFDLPTTGFIRQRQLIGEAPVTQEEAEQTGVEAKGHGALAAATGHDLWACHVATRRVGRSHATDPKQEPSTRRGARRERLPAVREVDDRQPPHAEREAALDVEPFAVGSTMHDRIEHGAQHDLDYAASTTPAMPHMRGYVFTPTSADCPNEVSVPSSRRIFFSLPRYQRKLPSPAIVARCSIIG